MPQTVKLSLPVLAPILALLLAGSALAQTEPAQTEPAEDGEPAEPPAQPGLSLGEPVTTGPQVGEPYVSAEFGDWLLRCVVSGTEDDPCQLYQLLSDQEDNPVAEISVFPLPDGQQAEAGVTLITPLETLLSENVTLRVDAGEAKRYPFTFCTAVGCVARIGLLPDEVNAFRRGNMARVRIVPAAAPDQEVLLEISLRGFTAGFAALAEGVARAAE
jgi:invasion protein IalB